MTLESRCVLDAAQPCHACSAPDPSRCPYLYLLGWDGPGSPSAGTFGTAGAGGVRPTMTVVERVDARPG
jgi:hypothetical protein